MNQTQRIAPKLLIALAAASLAFAGCGKKDDKKKEDKTPASKPETKPETKPAVKPEPKPEPKPEAKPAADADYVKILASHEPATPTDPVTIAIETFTVKSASFDPANMEAATAELELDLNSIKSDKANRDGHLKSADYLDVAKFGKATVKIAEVKKTDDKNFTATAEVIAHGVTKKIPVSFTVLESSADSLKVKASQEFQRLDFGIGKKPDGKTEKVAEKLTLELQLTLKKS